MAQNQCLFGCALSNSSANDEYLNYGAGERSPVEAEHHGLGPGLGHPRENSQHQLRYSHPIAHVMIASHPGPGFFEVIRPMTAYSARGDSVIQTLLALSQQTLAQQVEYRDNLRRREIRSERETQGMRECENT